MHETIEIIPADADVGIVGNDILRSRIDDWISRIDRIDRETCLFRDYLPRDDERREWVARVHQRLVTAGRACVSLIAVLNQTDRTPARQEEFVP